MLPEDQKTKKVLFCLPESQYIELKIMAVLSKRTMSSFIRKCVQEKIKELKEKK